MQARRKPRRKPEKTLLGSGGEGKMSRKKRMTRPIATKCFSLVRESHVLCPRRRQRRRARNGDHITQLVHINSIQTRAYDSTSSRLSILLALNSRWRQSQFSRLPSEASDMNFRPYDVRKLPFVNFFVALCVHGCATDPTRFFTIFRISSLFSV